MDDNNISLKKLLVWKKGLYITIIIDSISETNYMNML